MAEELESVREILQRHPVVAVLGAHPERHRAACYVPATLHGQRYRVLPVNPRAAGQTLRGQPMDPPPRVVWFQLGVRHDAVARRLEEAGVRVVQDRCTLAEHRRLGLGAPRRPDSPDSRIST